MKLYVSYFLMTMGSFVSSETLDEAIIKDMMPESSSTCTPTAGSTSSDFTFASSQEECNWFDGYEESFEKYNAPWSQLEEHVFNGKMMHTDVSSNRTWTLRLGKGGNIYSMVGPMGETVAPQKRIDSPWIDEVWHSVGVEPPQPEEPYMVHGAGSYQSDQTYGSNVGVPLTEVPFYSPSLGKYCNDEEGECGFAAWAQHGPVPVYWESTMLNFNRYRDCGNGVIEHTAVHHNNMGSQKNLMRLDAPFGSVRFSTLRDVVMTDQDSEILIEPHQLGRYDTDPWRVSASDTMGYAIFAEDLPGPLTGSYPLDNGVSLTISGGGCRAAPDYWGYDVIQCAIEPTEKDLSGTNKAIRFRGTPPSNNPYAGPGGDIVAKNGVIWWSNQFVTGGVQWLFFYPDKVPGEDDMAAYVNSKFPVGSTLEVLYDTGKPEEDNLALAHVFGNDFSDSKHGIDDYPQLIVGNANEGSKPRDANCYNMVSVATAMSEGGSFYFRQYFVMDRFSDISETAARLASEVRQDNYNMMGGDDAPEGRTVNLYKDGNIVGATIGDDSPCRGNEKLFPYPTDDDGSTIILKSKGNMGVARHTSRLGKCVLTTRLQNLSEEARNGPQEKLVFHFVSEAGVVEEPFYVDGIRHWFWKQKRMLFYPSAPYDTEEACPEAAAIAGERFPENSYINITYVDEDENYEINDSPVCSGSTTPKIDSKALFEIKCGTSTYIGSDPYYFAPDGFSDDDFKKRPYICKNDNTARGNWRLLGFFPDGACSDIETDHMFDGDMCRV